MLALQLVAFFFLLLSAAFMYGPQLVVFGPRALPELMQNGQAQFVGGCLASAVLTVFLLPYLGGAFSSGGSAVTLVMADIFTMSFSLH
ncbi:MAG: hypothetical protein AAGL11_02465 [Pseudomonadota bacterium]